MKKILLSMVAIFFAMAVSAQVIYLENFDNLTVGNKVASSATGWTTWSNLPGSAEDGVVTSLHSSSGLNSGMVSLNNDLVWMIGDSTTGKYEVSLKVYVPADSCGYFNVLHKFAGGSSEWSNDVYILPHDSTIRLFVGGNDTAQALFTFDTWHTVTYSVDCDYDFVRMSFDGVEMFSWPWSLDAATGTAGLNQIGAMDFYGLDIYSAGNYKLYIDDVKFENIVNISIKDVTAFNETIVYPSPTTDVLNMQTTKLVKTIKIIDITGSVVKEYNVNDMSFSMDVSELASGLYYAQMNFGSSIAIRKFIKK